MAAERPAGDFGSKLREARERRGISLRQIANATKISVVALEALERNDVSRLPGGIFSRAFVRSYALEVGLEPEQAIQEFIAQFPHDSVTAGHPQASQVEDNEALESNRRTATTFVRLVAVSIPIAGLVIYFGMARQPAPAASPESAVASAASTGAKPDLAPPLSSASTDSVAGASRTQAAASTDAPADAAPPPAEAASDVLSVGLLATRPCWVSATADGTRTIERVLQAGERASMEIRRELVLTVGDAAAITLTLNGAEARRLGGDKQVVTARLNLNTFRDYLPAR